MKIIIILMLLSFMPHGMVVAQDATVANGNMVSYEQSFENAESVDETSVVSPEIEKLRINNEFWSIVLLSGLCVISLIIVLGFIKQQEHSAKDIVNAAGLTLIIFGTIILVLVVNTSEQLTAAIGILGAIAGYLFRSVQNSDSAKS
ncbi:MAG: hypothetical protein OEY89_09840 [Gammaproteobacteria bacterium]|nr:hypothetical protein [Gammaproteobacteria bacterium]